MKLKAATKQAMVDLGVPEYTLEEYLKSGSQMNKEMREKCCQCLKMGQMQEMSDTDYEKYSEEAV